MTKRIGGVPGTSSRIMPRLVCRDPDAAIDFYIAVLDATELGRRPGPDGHTAHALLTIGSAMFMVESEWPAVPARAPVPGTMSSVIIFAYMDDVDDTVQRAVDHGAQLLIPATNQFWGDRTAWIMDPAGHLWTLATRIEETTEAVREERWSDELERQREAGRDNR
jgi:PhnB protein